jgi:hypothetical protein
LFAILQIYKLSYPVALIAAQNLNAKEQTSLGNGKVYFPFFSKLKEKPYVVWPSKNVTLWPGRH